MRENLRMMSLARNYNSELARQVASLIEGSERVLDFGCGIGTIAKLVKSMRPDAKIVCVDAEEEFLKELPQDFERYTSMEEIGEKVDVIYTINVLEHIREDQEVLYGFYNLLKAKGKLFIYVPAFPLLYSKMDEEVGHVRRYTKQELEQKVKRAGFKILSIQYEDPIGFFASLYLKLLKKTPKQEDVQFYDRWVFPISRALSALTAKLVGKNISVFAQKF